MLLICEFMLFFYGVYFNVICVVFIIVMMGFLVVDVFVSVLFKMLCFLLFVRWRKIFWFDIIVGNVKDICWCGVVVGWVVIYILLLFIFKLVLSCLL